MSFLKGLVKPAKPAPTDPRQLIGELDRYLSLSEKEDVSLGLFCKERLLLRVEPLKFAPPWKDRLENKCSFSDDAHLFYFLLPEKKIAKNPVYLRYLASGLKFQELPPPYPGFRIRIFAEIIPRPEDSRQLARQMLETVMKIYDFDGTAPMMSMEIFHRKEPGDRKTA